MSLQLTTTPATKAVELEKLRQELLQRIVKNEALRRIKPR